MIKTLIYFCVAFIALALCPLTGISLAQETPQQSWQANPGQVDHLQAKFDEAGEGLNAREENVPKYVLPDPLVFEDGTPVKTVEDWTNRRRPEILNLFREHVYGIRPDTPYEVEFKELDKKEDVYGIGATAKHVAVTIKAEKGSQTFDFVLVTPKAEEPVPLILLINHRWSIESLDKAVGETRSFWPAEKLVREGYATVSMGMSKVDPDNKNDGYEQGIRALLDAPDSDPMTRWHTISAWGWGASRALDYCLEQPEIDPQRTAVAGHSRGGKAALWAAAEDTRFKLAFSNNSGCGGAALSRRAYGESVARINKSFPHWFCGNFSKYNKNESELPVDQHQLIALIPPRAVYVTSRDRDLWADPRGEYTSVVKAGPVYDLFGIEHITNPAMPALDSPRHVGKTGYHILSGRHSLDEQDWGHFLDFADIVFNRKKQ
jgi:dienelactone hydrolase